MRYGNDDLLDLIRMEAADVVAERQFEGTLVATGYDPDTHMVKGMIMPHRVESGWVRIGASHVGNGFGIVAGPNVGDPKKLDGDQFSLHYEGGDANNLVATHKHFSKKTKPPRVESGEMMMKREDGGSLFFAKDGSITTTHKDGGSQAFDKDGNVTVKSNNKSVTIDAGSGSQSFKGSSHSFDGNVSVTGKLDASETVNGATGVTSGGLAVRTV